MLMYYLINHVHSRSCTYVYLDIHKRFGHSKYSEANTRLVQKQVCLLIQTELSAKEVCITHMPLDAMPLPMQELNTMKTCTVRVCKDITNA